MTYDVIVRNGLWFDGTGAPPQTRTLGIRDGIVAAVSAEPLDETGCPDVIDAEGKWIVPGFIDVHTHYDAEVLLDPGLRESVRHGVTTVLLGNCSLSTVYADSEDAADLFSRVEAVPRKYVLGALEAKKTWSTPAEYVRALDELPLGPNVGSMLGHSDLRTSVLGLDRATTEDVRPTDAELERMAELLEQALDAGLLGMSGMDAPIDKLDGDRFRSRALPSTFATWRERRRLIKVLRKRGRILQSAPNTKNPVSALMFFLTSSRMFGRRPGVRMSLLVSADAKSATGAVHVFGPGTRILNRVFGLARAVPASAGAVRAVLRRHRPARLRGVRRGHRRPAPARPDRAQRTARRHRSTAAGSAVRSTARSSARRCGTAIFTTPPSSNAPTRP